MTRREPVNAQTPRAGVNDKKVVRLEKKREWVQKEEWVIDGESRERARDVQLDSTSFRLDKYKVKEGRARLLMRIVRE